MILRVLNPVTAWKCLAVARAVNTMVRWASVESRVRWNMGLACRSVLLIRMTAQYATGRDSWRPPPPPASWRQECS